MKNSGFHNHSALNLIVGTSTEVHLREDLHALTPKKQNITYKISNHFHPYVGNLITKLNNESLPKLLDADFLKKLGTDEEPPNEKSLNKIYEPQKRTGSNESHPYEVEMKEREIDVSKDGPYSVYNWELFFHVPFTIAVHLSKNQRYAEAQRWFHYIFDPTNNDTSIDAPQRFWNFLAFRKKTDVQTVQDFFKALNLSKDNDKEDPSIEAWRKHPFQPHVIARTRLVAYQIQVIMKYLDNLVAWGDSLFRQDSIETLNEATQLYVLAANILGPKPQAIPRRGTTKAQTFATLKNKLDSFGNALVEMENAFPFNQSLPKSKNVNSDATRTLLGIGQSLYFCIPKNDKLLGYWDLVGDRLFKIRHCMNIEGIVRQLPLFQPPIDPGMLVKAAAGGIDIGSLISGLNQPISPIRSILLIQKAQEICGEVRSLGGGLLSALEKKDGESIALLRQTQEIHIQELARDVRYLQWKESESSTASILKSRESAYQRYRYYKMLLGDKEGDFSDLEQIDLERTALSEENFDEVYQELVSQYETDIELDDYSILEQASNGESSGILGTDILGVPDQSALHLNLNEAKESEHLLDAKRYRLAGTTLDSIAAVLTLIPDFNIDLHPWGMGTSSKIGGGGKLSDVSKTGAQISRGLATWEQDKAGMVSKTASYQRRANDWILQANLAAKELTQMGRQIISSLIREQITKKEYDNQLQQIENAKEVDTFLKDKFTNKELYYWMQGELSKLYHESYKFAFDIAKKAEQTMKHELMRPEADERDFIKFNYWDTGRKGLLSGEALSFDLKRMEMAYHDYNKREYELTKHISINQLNPLALLQLKATGSCTLQVPEWIFDLDCPGHYMRRIKTVAVSVPAVTGPYTNVNCTLSLQKSTIRKSALIGNSYMRQTENEDDRFIDYFGTIQSIVTSSAQNDSGLFEVNLQGERFLPFENAGVESTWRLELPAENRQFDYNTITDVIIHIRYTARQGGAQLAEGASTHIKDDILDDFSESGLTRLFSLKHDFPNAWHKYKSSPPENKNFQAKLSMDQFPYIAQLGTIALTTDQFELYQINKEDFKLEPVTFTESDILLDNGQLKQENREANIEIKNILGKNQEYFLLIKYNLI